MKVVSINIGEKKKIEYKNKVIETGIFKYPVNYPVFLEKEEIEGDTISDRKYHGGVNQAVYGYSLRHYDYWKLIYPNLDWTFGMFGENLTIDDLDENKINVGDVFKLGDATIEATLQRNPCFKLGIRFNDMKIVKQFWKTSMCGVYFKVLQTGSIQTGDKLSLIKKNYNSSTISELFEKQKVLKGING